jgi:hypothetical protein
VGQERQREAVDSLVLELVSNAGLGRGGFVVGIDRASNGGDADLAAVHIECVLGVVQDREAERPIRPVDGPGQVDPALARLLIAVAGTLDRPVRDLEPRRR